MVVPPKIHVSVDVGCRRHSVAIGLSSGEVLEEFDIDHRPEGFADFFNRIERQHRCFPGAVPTVAMEGYNGHARPLDTLICKRGWRLLNVNNLKLARFKQMFPAAAKSDRIDARRMLDLMLLGEHMPQARRALQEVHAPTSQNAQLKRLTRRRRALVDEKSRVLARMQGDLRAVCPGLLEITGDAENRWFLNLLTHVDDLQKLARLREKTLRGIPAIGAKYAAIIRQWQPQAQFSHEAPYAGPMIIEDAQRILALREAIDALERRCQALAEDSDIARLIDTVPGFALVCSAELAGEISTLDRFAGEASLAVYLGMANLDNSSGERQGARAPGQVNKRAKAAMMTGVDRHRKQVPESQRYYEKKRAEGKTHNQAIRALGRHLCRVLYRMLKHGEAYRVRQPEAPCATAAQPLAA
ncbi:transposase IS116/IS110/IS902 family [Thioflavicoccus mobilis 8321]|uniref:Transposase IS116/IS110/IS902 family n=1 Tax=Thioflavicoccus mobilis 8321 TaxID=765912 RepID=L0GX86_9GAMM|nr:IS110 family transposase [Thioflavicoccus mobilis]AGA90442.1 transposase IS116/IS110/IS902 family [Thioflavicoccus mobilis 8321]